MKTKQEEIRERVIEIIASALSDNDVRPRGEEILALFKEEITKWLIERRRKLQEKKEVHLQQNPKDIQSARLAGIKARALQEVINYFNSIFEIDNVN